MGLYDRSQIYSRQIETAYRDGGTFHVVFSIAKKIAWPVCQVGYLMFFEKDLANHSVQPAKISSIRLALLNPGDCTLLASSRPGDPRVFARARERFDKGDQCFVALTSNNDVAHSRWVSTNDTYIPELEMHTRPRLKQAYMYDGYSKPEYRGRGIDGAVRNFIFETMKSQGAENVYSYVRSDNPVGIRAARRWQSQIGRVWYMHLRDADAFIFGQRKSGMPLLIRM
jgi:ribosomal protein S18 acetylase RimI-like enzyme